MRVLCIDDDFSHLTSNDLKYIISLPVQLEVYTVIDTVDHPRGLGYILKEVPTLNNPNANYPHSWKASRFVPIMPSDVEELQETEQETMSN